MKKSRYHSPIIMEIESGGAGEVTGEGTGQGSISPENYTFDEWWNEIAWGGENPDCDYNGDGVIDEDDYYYWLENELWNGGD